jgi:hypothetical protein
MTTSLAARAGTVVVQRQALRLLQRQYGSGVQVRVRPRPTAAGVVQEPAPGRRRAGCPPVTLVT